MKWQDINKKTSALILTGVFGLIFMISQLTGVDVNYTNYPDCINGTDCYAKFEIDSSYYRICFNIDDSVETPQYFKKQSRSRTLWVNTSRYGFVTTEPGILTKLMVGTTKSRGIEQAPDGKWLRDVKTGDCIERKKTNYLYVKGVKDKYTDVIWKMDLFGIDPIWKAEDETIKIKDKDYKIKDKIDYKGKNITGEDFYKLISIETSLSYGIQIYEAVNLFDKKMPISNFVGRILKKTKSKETNSMNITVLLNESYLSPVYKLELINKTCNKTDNITHEIIFYDCSYNVSVFDYNETKYRWNEYNITNQEIKPDEIVRIKVYATWAIKLGENSRDFLPGVIIPKEYVEDEDIILEAVNMTWWNGSWDYKREVTITTDYNYTHYPANFSINLSTEYTAGKVNQTCGDIRMTNSSEDGELYYDVVICNLSDSDIATFSVHLDTITTDNDTMYLYYGNNDGETTEDYFNTYHRHNSDLVFDMPLKTGTGSTAYDVSGQGNNGTLTNGASFVSGGGVIFDGDNDFVNCGSTNFPIGSNVRTIEVIVKTDVLLGAGDYNCIFSYGSGSNYQAFWIGQTQNTDKLYVGIYGEDKLFDFAFQTDIWYHIIVNLSGQVSNTFVDGEYNDSVTFLTTPNTILSSAGIAGGTPLAGYQWDGTISMVRLYNSSLSPTDIQLLYNETKYPPTFSFGAEETSDSGAPTYSTNSTNSTLAGTSIEHRLRWEDDTALAGYIFSFDNGTGSFTNDTWVSMTGVLNWSNVTKTVNSTVGATIQWKVYANDSSDNWNESLTYSYTTIDPFKFKITTTSSPENFSFQTDNAVDLLVDWGDGNDNTYSGTGLRTHEYATAGDYNISLTGQASRISFYEGTPTLLKDILTPMSNSVTGITSAENMFRSASGITTFTAEDFFDDVSGDVTNMYLMFYSASAFNQNLSNWDTSAVTTMSSMFSYASAFNGDISNWNTSAVTTMSYMFYSASAFNQNLSNWDTSAVTTMSSMFSYASAFNGDISNWNTSAVTTMSYMFYSASAFNGDISNWNTSAVTTMSYMFGYASAFNQNISNWDTSAVTKMNDMFKNATVFNQDIGNWNTQKVDDMDEMFENAYDFEQNLSDWNVSAVLDMTEMFNGITLSVSNYDSLLVGWAGLTPNLQGSVNFHGGNSQYSSSGTSARNDTLIGIHSWVITDGGYLSPDTCSNCDGTSDCYWDCSDDCNITTNINMGGYSIKINQSTGGTHTINITANITNHSGVVGSGYNSSDMCFAIGESGGGFK